jgi:hypothetical protein
VAPIENEVRDLIERSRALREQCNRLKDVSTKLWDNICSQKWPHCPVCGDFALTAIRRSKLAEGEDDKAVLAFRCIAGHTWIPPEPLPQERLAFSASSGGDSGPLSRKL